MCLVVHLRHFARIIPSKKTSIDGKDQFGPEAAKTLQHKFYEHDLLKSVA